jgi:hypothetical protein
LVELTKGNLFENNSGTFDIIGALDYIMVEPFNHIAKYNDIDLSYIQGSSIRKPVDLLFPDGVRDFIINLKIKHKQSGISREESLEKIITELQKKRSEIEE